MDGSWNLKLLLEGPSARALIWNTDAELPVMGCSTTIDSEGSTLYQKEWTIGHTFDGGRVEE